MTILVPIMVFATVLWRVIVIYSAQQDSQQNSVPPPTFCSSNIDIASYLPGGAHEDPDVRRVNFEIDSTFAEALTAATFFPPPDKYHQTQLLGTLLLFDKTLSVKKNLACTSCHDPATAYTGGSSLFNQTIVAYPGSVAISNAPPGAPNYRISARKPQSYTYAAYAPILHYNATQGDLYGGNFWDMRATGTRLGNCAAEQAEGPPTNPLEHGYADFACMVYRVSQSPYRTFFERVWGPQSFAVTWPANIEQVCSTPGPPPANDPFPVHLTPVDRGTISDTFDHIALAIAQYEASTNISPFSSKFDFALANPTQQVFSATELAGWSLFRGKAQCNTCHLDGNSQLVGNVRLDGKNGRDGRDGRDGKDGNSKRKGDTTTAKVTDKAPLFTDKAPLFTDFTSANLGLPKNFALPFYCENHPDQFGFTANPAGVAYIDRGVGDMLRGPNNPNPDWVVLAPQFDGKFRVPTLRNVDMRPYPGFVKAYMHNGYLKSLKEVVHFYNTRDKFPHCPQGSSGEKVTCWPPPEVLANEDKTIGNLGLTDEEENEIVAFMQTLTDGYFKP
jgi:cytochrome c peroxidase